MRLDRFIWRSPKGLSVDNTQARGKALLDKPVTKDVLNAVMIGGIAAGTIVGLLYAYRRFK